MHERNRRFWAHCAGNYPSHFAGPGAIVAEFGSRDVNGSIREHFKNVGYYVGVDWRPGPLVDLVCAAKDILDHFPEKFFTTAVSASMLEHDPEWDQSVRSMVKVLAPGGFLGLSWGSALNRAHEEWSAIDGRFHALQAGKVLRLVKELGLDVREFWYEADLPDCDDIPEDQENPGKGVGEVALVAFLRPADHIADVPRHASLLRKEDEIS